MMPKIVLLLNGNPIAEHPIQIDESGLANDGKDAFDFFRRQFPELSLFDERVSFRFDKA